MSRTDIRRTFAMPGVVRSIRNLVAQVRQARILFRAGEKDIQY